MHMRYRNVLYHAIAICIYLSWGIYCWSLIEVPWYQAAVPINATYGTKAMDLNKQYYMHHIFYISKIAANTLKKFGYANQTCHSQIFQCFDNLESQTKLSDWSWYFRKFTKKELIIIHLPVEFNLRHAFYETSASDGECRVESNTCKNRNNRIFHKFFVHFFHYFCIIRLQRTACMHACTNCMYACMHYSMILLISFHSKLTKNYQRMKVERHAAVVRYCNVCKTWNKFVNNDVMKYESRKWLTWKFDDEIKIYIYIPLIKRNIHFSVSNK